MVTTAPRLLLSTFLIFGALATQSGAEEPKLPDWVNDGKPYPIPNNGWVPDAHTAISIARTIWLAGNHDIDPKVATDDAWQAEMQATLANGVWTVFSKNRGVLEMFIAQSDGRMLGLILVL